MGHEAGGVSAGQVTGAPVSDLSGCSSSQPHPREAPRVVYRSLHGTHPGRPRSRGWSPGAGRRVQRRQGPTDWEASLEFLQDNPNRIEMHLHPSRVHRASRGLLETEIRLDRQDSQASPPISSSQKGTSCSSRPLPACGLPGPGGLLMRRACGGHQPPRTDLLLTSPAAWSQGNTCGA